MKNILCGVSSAVLFSALAACGGSDWRAGMVWDGRDENGDGSVVVIVARYKLHDPPSQPAGSLAAVQDQIAVQRWQPATASAPLRKALSELVSSPTGHCESGGPHFELTVGAGPHARLYLSDNWDCGEAPAAKGFVELQDLINFAALMQEEL